MMIGGDHIMQTHARYAPRIKKTCVFAFVRSPRHAFFFHSQRSCEWEIFLLCKKHRIRIFAIVFARTLVRQTIRRNQQRYDTKGEKCAYRIDHFHAFDTFQNFREFEINKIVEPICCRFGHSKSFRIQQLS